MGCEECMLLAAFISSIMVLCKIATSITHAQLACVARHYSLAMSNFFIGKEQHLQSVLDG